jgi:DNA-binding response OmpR family regulator
MNAHAVPTTIMIIDDEPENLNVLGDMLRQEDWDVRAFPSGEMALAAAAVELPDLVLLDIRMPGLDGYEVCRRFKADERLRPIPIIFLSAFAEPADKVRAFAAGGVDYVTKPFAEVEVLARTHAHLRLRRYQVHLEDLVQQRVKELAEAHRRLRIWDNAKTDWLSMLSHEMRTPLTGVFCIADLLFTQTPPGSKVHALHQDYDVARRRIEKLMGDALTLAQIDVAAEHFAVSPQRLAPVLREALAAVAGQAPDHPVRADLSAVRRTTVLGEPELLARAFHDLLLTATCWAGAGEAVSLVTHFAAGLASVVIVTEGKSLSLDALETFFDIGGQRTLPRGGGDFGLSSSLASRILRLANGRVSVRNGLERGIIMEIVLPAEDRDV